MRIIQVKLDTNFDWYNPHLYQSTTEIIKLVLIIVIKASEVSAMLLVKFTSPLRKKVFDLHVFSPQHEKSSITIFWQDNGNMNLHVHFYVYARLKNYQNQQRCIYASFANSLYSSFASFIGFRFLNGISPIDKS